MLYIVLSRMDYLRVLWFSHGLALTKLMASSNVSTLSEQSTGPAGRGELDMGGQDDDGCVQWSLDPGQVRRENCSIQIKTAFNMLCV